MFIRPGLGVNSIIKEKKIIIILAATIINDVDYCFVRFRFWQWIRLEMRQELVEELQSTKARLLKRNIKVGRNFTQRSLESWPSLEWVYHSWRTEGVRESVHQENMSIMWGIGFGFLCVNIIEDESDWV